MLLPATYFAASETVMPLNPPPLHPPHPLALGGCRARASLSTRGREALCRWQGSRALVSRPTPAFHPRARTGMAPARLDSSLTRTEQSSRQAQGKLLFVTEGSSGLQSLRERGEEV